MCMGEVNACVISCFVFLVVLQYYMILERAMFHGACSAHPSIIVVMLMHGGAADTE